MSTLLLERPLQSEGQVPHMSVLEQARKAELRAALQRMHLQWFSAEDEGRTEDPTEHKIRKAREEGRVSKSTDFTQSLVLVVTVAALAILGSWLLSGFVEMLREFLAISMQLDPVNDAGLGIMFMNWMLRLGLPISLIAMVAGVAGELFQVGFLFTTKPIKPDPKRIMPKFGEYIKRSFASAEAFYNLAKAFVKIAVLILIAFVNIQGNLNQLLNLPKQTFLEGFGFIAWLTYLVMIESAIFMLAISLFDRWFQNRQFKESLKMTKQEIKEERKSYDGDPLIRSRLRQRMREILTQNMVRNVPKADVVVTNPTHYAVALQYEQQAMTAPTVLAKGQDLVAKRIREIAGEYGIPIIENKPLARALYAEVEVGDVIPEKFYEAVVVVLRQVYRLKQGKPNKQREAV